MTQKSDLIDTTLEQWIGVTQKQEAELSEFPLNALAATLDLTELKFPPNALVPPLWHWLYFLSITPASELDVDGHARRGGFLPPVPLPRRMWAGGRLDFFRPLRLGHSVERLSNIVNIERKQGRTGPLVFVLVRHAFHDTQGVALIEEHDIVYRDAPREPFDPEANLLQPALEPEFQQSCSADEVLLFRYSALTFNSHRIHIDRDYARDEEGYPGLVVHGPLLATLLMNLLRRQFPRAEVSHFSFRALHPVFDHSPFTLCGRRNDERHVALWVVDAQGRQCMEARVTLGRRESVP